MHIALYFGSFNPIHIGHLAVAEKVLQQVKVDALWFVISPQNPFKERKSLLDEQIRFDLVQKALVSIDEMKASNIEFSMPKPSFTADTMAKLKKDYPLYTFSIVMGSDTFEHIEKWKDYEDLLSNYDIIVYKREGASINQKLSKRLNILQVPLINISSTMIRNKIENNESIRYLVPDAIWKEIVNKNYYH